MNAPNFIRSLAAILVVAAALLFCGDQHVASAAGVRLLTRSIDIGVRVNVRCIILVNNGVYFPNTYVSGQAAPLDAQGSLYVDCDAGRRASIRLDQGLYRAPGSTARNPLRRMRDSTGTRYITYNLYEDAARTQVWDDDRPGVKTARAWPVSLPVYGRVFGGQTVYPGFYSDVIVANLFF